MDRLDKFEECLVDLEPELTKLFYKHGPHVYACCLWAAVLSMEADLLFDGVEIFTQMKKNLKEGEKANAPRA